MIFPDAKAVRQERGWRGERTRRNQMSCLVAEMAWSKMKGLWVGVRL